MASLGRRAAYVAGFLALAVLFYEFLGPGPTPSERAQDLPWWRPAGWAWALDGPVLETFQSLGRDYQQARRECRWEWGGLLVLALFSLPPIALTVLGFRLFAPAPARVPVLALGLTLCAFVYYGWLDPITWREYSWRWPIALFVTAAYLSVFALAPALVREARARSPAVQAAALLAFFLPVYVLSTEVTGTDPSLEWNLSPWPVITLYGFLLFGLLFGVIHLAAGAGVVAASRLGGRAGVAAGAVLAAALALLLHWIPFSALDPLKGLALAAPAALLAAWVGRRSAPTRPATPLLLAGLVLVASIKAGQWQAEHFQAQARDEIAPQVIAALERHRAEHGTYPEQLPDLVPEYLPEIPAPRVGWFGEGGEAFEYIDLGDSFLLEFSSVLWVQCHYSPAYREDAEPGEDVEGTQPRHVASGPEAPETLQSVWSCERRPPRLW